MNVKCLKWTFQAWNVVLSTFWLISFIHVHGHSPNVHCFLSHQGLDVSFGQVLPRLPLWFWRHWWPGNARELIKSLVYKDTRYKYLPAWFSWPMEIFRVKQQGAKASRLYIVAEIQTKRGQKMFVDFGQQMVEVLDQGGNCQITDERLSFTSLMLRLKLNSLLNCCSLVFSSNGHARSVVCWFCTQKLGVGKYWSVL